jgi:hypothetical protein
MPSQFLGRLLRAYRKTQQIICAFAPDIFITKLLTYYITFSDRSSDPVMSPSLPYRLFLVPGQLFPARFRTLAADICEYVHSRWGIPLIPNTLHHIAARDVRLRSAEADPIENLGMEVPDSAIHDHFVNLALTIRDIPAQFVFNMDEMGHQACADAQSKSVFVPSEAEWPITYPVPRTGKRMTLIVCIAADGSRVCPAVVTTRYL